MGSVICYVSSGLPLDAWVCSHPHFPMGCMQLVLGSAVVAARLPSRIRMRTALVVIILRWLMLLLVLQTNPWLVLKVSFDVRRFGGHRQAESKGGPAGSLRPRPPPGGPPRGIRRCRTRWDWSCLPPLAFELSYPMKTLTNRVPALPAPLVQKQPLAQRVSPASLRHASTGGSRSRSGPTNSIVLSEAVVDIRDTVETLADQEARRRLSRAARSELHRDRGTSGTRGPSWSG